MTSQKVLESWKKNQFQPVYWFEGEEDYFIDELVVYAEKHILSPDEAGFNLTVFYGKDANWTEVLNTCRRYPVFAEKQVVILKEAQQMRDLDKLEPYLANPVPSTIFVASHKGKALDGRTKLAQTIKKKGVLLQFKKIYENQLPQWTVSLVESKGFQIDNRALILLVNHVGNDLARIANEIDKLALNISGKTITPQDIETYIGISKEFNAYELQDALATKDLKRAVQIINYFSANPKAAPLPLLFIVLYSFFTKMLLIKQLPVADKSSIRGMFYNNPVLIDQALVCHKKYSFEQLEQAILILHEYNLKMVGVNSKIDDSEILKEMVFKTIAC